MKIYLAHNYAARYELRKTKLELEALNHEVTSRWIDNEHEINTDNSDAIMDYEDVMRADTLILFADEYGDRPGTGKFIEFGFAYALGKSIIVVSDQEKPRTIFFALPRVWKATSKTWLEQIQKLSKLEQQR